MSSRSPGERSDMTDADIISLFREKNSPVVTSQDLIDEWGLSRTGARYRLDKLVDDGTLARKKVGGSAVVWWLKTDSES